MTKTAFYSVAGHRFSLTLPDSGTLWQALGQYDPFVVQEGETLFGLDLCGPISTEGSEVAYDAPTEDGETVVRLLKIGKDWIFEIAPDHRKPVCARMLVKDDFSHGRLHLENDLLSDAVFGINNAVMLLYAFRTSALDTLEMHASVILNNGKAFLFLGKSGTGKSTHSRLWLNHIPGSELMNDDNPVVRVMDDGSVIAYGSPWSGKTPCYRNVSAPVGAFVRIRQDKGNRIIGMNVIEAYAALYSSSSGFKADRRMADGLHSSMEKIATSTPFFTLFCRPDEEAARVCAEKVLNINGGR